MTSRTCEEYNQQENGKQGSQEDEVRRRKKTFQREVSEENAPEEHGTSNRLFPATFIPPLTLGCPIMEIELPTHGTQAFRGIRNSLFEFLESDVNYPLVIKRLVGSPLHSLGTVFLINPVHIAPPTHLTTAVQHPGPGETLGYTSFGTHSDTCYAAAMAGVAVFGSSW
jgi:hypothetical protein